MSGLVVVLPLLVLPPSLSSAPLAPPPGRVSGVILDPEGRPVANATVELMWWSSTEGTVGYRGMHGDQRPVRTGPRGEFSLIGLTPGRLNLTFLIPGMLDVYSSDRRLRPGHPITDLLVKSPGYGGAVSGVVRNEFGRPVPRALVSTGWAYGDPSAEPDRHPTGDNEAWTGPDGRFRLPHIQPGKQRVTAYARGWPPAGVEVRVAEGAEASADLVLQRCYPGTWTLSARVVDESGRAVPGAKADVVWDEKRLEARGYTSPAYVGSPLGGLLVYDLPAGKPVPMRVFDQDHGRWEGALVGSDGEYRRDVIRLSAATTLRGTIRVPDGGRPAARMLEVELERQAGEDPRRSEEHWLWITPDANGRYRIAGLFPGKWKLGVDVDGGRRKLTETIEVAPGQSTIEHDLVFPAGASLSGQVTDADRRPLFGSRVLLWRKDRSYGPLEVEYGRYRFRDIDPGAYDAVAWAPGFWPASLSVALPEGADWSDADVRLGDGPVVSGIVVDGAGRPLPDAPVWLDATAAYMSLWHPHFRSGQPPAGPPWPTPTQDALQYLRGAAVAFTDPDGRFALRGVHAPWIALFVGTHLEWANEMGMSGRPSGTAGWHPYPIEPRLEDGRYMEAGGAAVDLGDGQSVSDVVLRVAKAVADEDLCRVRGTVTDPHGQFAGLSGLTVVVSQNPLPWDETVGAHARLTRPENDWASLGADGAFEIHNVPPGSYTVLVGGAEGAFQLASVELRPGSSVDLGELPVPVAGVVEGMVLDAEGRPVTSGSVLAGRQGTSLSASAAEWKDFRGERQAIRPDGAYRFEQLGPGFWHVMTVCPSEPASAIRRVFVNGGTQRADFRHSYTGRVAGRVADTGGCPVAEITVRCQGQTLREDLKTKTLADGRYELVGLPPGRYYVKAEGWLYFSGPARQVEVPETATPVRQDFVVEAGGWIEARLVTAEGKLVTGAEGRYTGQVGPPWGDESGAWLRADGKLYSGLLRPGTYVVRVRRAGTGDDAWVESEPVTVTAGQPRNTVVELPPGQ